MKFFLLIFICLSFISCSDSNFKKVETLDSFRVLAIVADKPEANPGDTVNLSLFISDAGESTGRVIKGIVNFCRDPGVSYGAQVDCSFDEDRVETTLTVDTSTPEFLNNNFTAFSDPVSVTIPADFLEQRSILEKTNGVSYLAVFEFNVDGKVHQLFKRVVVTTRVDLNSNPASGEIFVNGETFSGNASKGDSLVYKGNAPENYSYINVDGMTEMKTEEYSVAWYLTNGEVNFSKTNTDEETEIEKISDESFVIIGVLRDDRGGVEVQRLTVP